MRRTNQDHMGYCFTRDVMLIVFCDGLGGHSLGEVAARRALQTMARQFQRHTRPSVRNPRDFLCENIMLVHRDIYHYAETNGLPDVPRMTIICALTQRGSLHWAHTNNSRMYLMHKGELVMRTRDHSKVENLLQQDRVLPVQVVNHPERNKIYNCLGSSNLSLINIGGPVNPEPDDAATLYSDELWDSVQKDELIGTCANFPATQAIPELTARALRDAGDSADNTTAISMVWELDAVTIAQDSVQIGTLLLNVFTTSTLDAPQSESGPMSEEEIERSIIEIHITIDKTNNLAR